MKNFIVLLILTYTLRLSGCGSNGKNDSTNTDIAEVPSVQYAEQITIDKLPAVSAVESPQRQVDFSELRHVVGARQEVFPADLLCTIIQSEYTSRYGQPAYIMQVKERDLGGEFRIGLLNHATIDEIKEDRRRFIECTWVIGRDNEGVASDYLTCWYEQRGNGPVLVEAYKWETGWEF